MPLLTQKAYATRRGVTPQYINKCVREGIIVLSRGKVDPKKADAALAARREHKPRQRAAARAASPGRPPRGTATHSLTEGRAQKVHFEALQAKLEYERSVGLLLPKAEVLEAERRKNANIRTRFRRLARSLAPLLARTQNAAEAEALLLAEIDLQLQELAADPLGDGAPAPLPTEPPVVQTSANSAVAV